MGNADSHPTGTEYIGFLYMLDSYNGIDSLLFNS